MNNEPNEVKPNQVYKLAEVAKFFRVDLKTIYKNKDDLGGKKIGKGYKFLGENILKYLDCPDLK